MAEHEMTRAELQAALDKANADLVAARAEIDKPNPLLQAELERTQLELAKLKPAAAGKPVGEMPKKVPYKGMVQATEDCNYEGYRNGPKFYNDKDGKRVNVSDGDIFAVDVPALWSDDPYVPVLLKMTEAGQKYSVPNPDAPVRIDFRFRPRVSVSTDIAPLRAGQY